MGKNLILQKGNQCLEQREAIPGAPLWHMGKVALFESKKSFDLIQNTIDYLTCKAKLRKAFTDEEKEFMKEFFEALWWGGRYKGIKEAATLADHYVNGNGLALRINADVYTSAVIVKDTMHALKAYIRTQWTDQTPLLLVKTGNPFFLRSDQAKPLQASRRNVYRQGYILADGALLVEQENVRLKNADHRFHLTVNTTRSNQFYTSTWRVESEYDFEPFTSKNYITDIPLAAGYTIKLPDGLSHYLTIIGVAKAFIYLAEWTERWS